MNSWLRSLTYRLTRSPDSEWRRHHLTSVFLRSWLAVQPSLGGGYLGMQEGVSLWQRQILASRPLTNTFPQAGMAAESRSPGNSEAPGAGLCPFPGDICLVSPPHSTGPQAHPGEDLLSQEQKDHHCWGQMARSHLIKNRRKARRLLHLRKRQSLNPEHLEANTCLWPPVSHFPFKASTFSIK